MAITRRNGRIREWQFLNIPSWKRRVCFNPNGKSDSIKYWSTADSEWFYCAIDVKNEIAPDLSLDKVQKKIVNVMSPLARVWKTLEGIKNDPTSTLSLEEVATNMGKSVLLLGQAFQAATYHRRFNALSSIMKDHRNWKRIWTRK